MTRFYTLLDKITGTRKTVPNFSTITSIGDGSLYYTFYNCTGLTGSVSFPNLTSIGNNGLTRVFFNCTGLTGSVSFPNLTTGGNSGLEYADSLIFLI